MAASQKRRIGARIREARQAMRGDDGKVISQREFARMLPGKVDGPSVSRWERGIVKPSDEYLEAIANVTGRDVSFFLVEEPQPLGAVGVASSAEEMLAQMQKAFDRGMAEIRREFEDLRRRLPPEDAPPQSGNGHEGDAPQTARRTHAPKKRKVA